MKWSRPRQQMLTKLNHIERARRVAAEARLADARAHAEEAVARKDDAELALGAAQESWNEHHSNGRFDLAFDRLLAGQLIARAGAAEGCDKVAAEALGREETEREQWRFIEASVRSSDHVLKRGRRRLARHAEDSRDLVLSDRTTWRWFQK